MELCSLPLPICPFGGEEHPSLHTLPHGKWCTHMGLGCSQQRVNAHDQASIELSHGRVRDNLDVNDEFM
jgi:hypothetical protein